VKDERKQMSKRILVLFCSLITVWLITGLVEAQQPGEGRI
jgi:hypothetical protein